MTIKLNNGLNFDLVPGFDGMMRSWDPMGILGGGPVAAPNGFAIGEPLIISGSGFGPAPSLNRQTVLSQSTATIGNDAADTDPGIDVSYFHADVKPKYSGITRSGVGRSLDMFQFGVSQYEAAQTLVSLPSLTEVFLSWSFCIPDGTHFPGATAPLTMPAESTWKVVWLLGDEASPSLGSNDDDYYIPAWADSWLIGGNDIDFGGGNPLPSFFEFGKWITVDVWLKADPTNPATANGTFYWGSTNTVGQLYEETWNTPIFNGGTAPYRWQNVNLGGWFRKRGDKNNCTPLMQDWRVRDKPNRVRIGDADVLANCTDLADCPFTSWEDDIIQCTLETGGIDLSNGAGVFVTDHLNQTTHVGDIEAQ